MPVNRSLNPVYPSWLAMRRNTSPKATPRVRRLYEGVSVCPEWTRYKAFEAWALSHGWQKGLRLTRRDKKGDFSPDNCFWATLEEANGWRSVVHRLGDGRSVRDIIGRDTRGLDKSEHGRVSRRIFKGGWDVPSAVVRPARHMSPKGMSRKYGPDSSLYTKWRNMRKAGVCCSGWKRFLDFKDWCLVNGWEEGLCLLRRDTKTGYHPGNCYFGRRADRCRC